MGISGLLPLLKSIQKPCNLKKFSGQTIGVDAYGWLHRGTVACAIDLALEKPTRKYVEFSMHRVRMLIHFGVIPYIVFDGDYLPSKAVTEVDRAKKREESKRKGLEFYRLNKPSQAHLELQKAVDVTPEMARQLIDELKELGIQYVVAPYEADAQLAYLERKGIIQGMISEDSDLLVFGAKRLLTKLDQYGDCVEINRADFTACREISLVGWSDAEFRRMAILSGCDYLASINRMGLKSAYRYVRKYKTIEKILQMLAFDGQYHIPTGYLEKFYKAELTFLHQRVFCPLKNDIVMMTELEDRTQPEDFSFIGGEVEKEIAINVARGDLDPMTKQPIYVKSAAKTTPRTPWGNLRRSAVTVCSESKATKSLDSFFKAKRTPLAELDPNSFTPSPTQVSLLQHASGSSWNSNPAPTRPSNSLTSTTSPSPAPRPQLPQNIVQLSTDLGATLDRQNFQKRRRLCLDLHDEQGSENTIPPEAGRSRFFASGIASQAPAKRNGRKRRKGKGPDFTVWSDDSIEDVMAELSKTPEKPIPVKTGKPKNFKDDDSEKAVDAAWTEIQQNESPEDDSQSSGVSKGTDVSEVSTNTQESSVTDATPTVAQILNKYVAAELKSLTAAFAYQPETRSMRSQRQEIESCKARPDHDASTGISSKPQILRQRSMTPLQRLGAGVLNRSKSCDGPLNSSHSVTELIKKNNMSAIGNTGTETVASSQATPDVPSEVSMMKGSEDAIIPDSEESADETLSGTEEQGKATIDLGRFAFSG